MACFGRTTTVSLLVSVTACLVALLFVGGLRGCMTAHSRPRGHQDVTFNVAPDGKVIVFNAAGQGGMDLYLLDLHRRRVRRIAATPEYEVAPSFSPDGRFTAYAAGSPGDRADHLYMCSLDGRRVTQLTSTEANDCSPSFTPDGSRIVFARDTNYRWGGLASNWSDGGSVWSIGTNGGGLIRLLPEHVFAISPCISPDGKKIVWWDTAGIGMARMGIIGVPRKIGIPGAREVALSPRGERLAFTAGRFSSVQRVYVMSLSSGSPIEVARAPGGCFHPVFGPDGHTIFYLVEAWPDGPSGNPKRSLWRVGDNGSHPRMLADSALFDDPLHWRP